jgi:hypothetical protein
MASHRLTFLLGLVGIALSLVLIVGSVHALTEALAFDWSAS